MSYIKIEIGGKERGLKFNQLAIVTLAKKADPDNYNATANYAMIYAGLVANNYVKGEENDFTFEDVCDWVDELSDDIVVAVDKCMSESLAYQKLIDAGKKEKPTDKKKLKKATKIT